MSSLKTCYNKGCGKSFDPSENVEDACTHHPGNPVFHDAYKGWSCCNKKCTDFTEFLNIKGCTVSTHNPVKPPEPEKYVPEKEVTKEVIEVRAPEPKAMPRPSLDTPMVELKANISQSLLDQVKCLKPSSPLARGDSASSIPVGTHCKNNTCKISYAGPESLASTCVHHPGVAVFHEGLKFWSCCNKKTTEFDAFLEQEGCTVGDHVWFKATGEKGQVKCRLDWFQTGSSVVVSIFAKKYDPSRSKVLLSPVRLKINLYFPEEEGTYEQDMQLRGIVDVEKSRMSMLGTKVEISLHKAEVGSWSKLDIPAISPCSDCNDSDKVKKVEEETNHVQHALDTVDLSDL